jgi:hypothetical protein
LPFRRQVFVDGDFLRHDADGLFDLARGVRDRVSHHQGVAGGGRQQAGKHRDGGTFPGSVGSQQAEDFPFPDREIQGLHGGEIAVALVQFLHLNGCAVFHRHFLSNVN